MPNILYYPHLNPIRFYLPSPDTTYESRFIDDFEFKDSIPEWEPQLDYLQPWNLSDHVFLFLLSDFGPHNIKVLDLDDNLIQAFTFSQVAQDINNPGLWVYQLDIDLSVFQEGVYRFQYEGGMDTKLILRSNKQEFCTRHKYSILLQYSHYQYHLGVMFETGIQFRFRVEGAILYKSPGSVGEDFQDQTQDETLLNSVNFRNYEMTVGDSGGVPDYVIDLIDLIFSCSDVFGDSKQFVKPKDEKWEPNELEDYPARGWKVALREGVNRTSKIFNNNLPVGGRTAIVIIADSKGFSTDTGGTNSQIIDVQ